MQARDWFNARDGHAAGVGTLHRAAVGVSPALMLVVLWLLTHRYAGLTGDAELYAFQAFARIHPSLANDIYLHFGSQAQYTIFSPFYAECIRLFGLANAALLLTILFKLWFFAASWMFARSLSTSGIAAASTALLVVAATGYGANGVFEYAEDWVTARSLAEALVATALVFHVRGHKVAAWLVALGSLLIHPLMGLPGLLLLACLRLPVRIGAAGAIAGILGSLGIALAASAQPSSAHFPVVVDADWLEIVRERSQFLFLQLWSAGDWMLNVRPFLSLAASAMILRDPQINRLCFAAGLVGASGIVVALIGSLIPVAILLQGQAWRWIWVTAFIGVILAVPTIFHAWRDKKCGSLCAVLFFSAWMLPAIAGAVCMMFALLLWRLRDRVSPRQAVGLRAAAAAFGAGVVVWTTKDIRHFASGAEPAHETFWLVLLRDVAGLKIFCLLSAMLIVSWIRASRVAVPVIATAALIGTSLLLYPRAFKTAGNGISSTEVDDFSDWRSAIPESANVLVLPSGNSPRFTWFTLERPSYLSVNQSSGVVFSRATALEVRRRAEVMLPVMDPDWRILSKITETRGNTGTRAVPYRALSGTALISLCADSQLNFVVAKESVGFEAIRHVRDGNWKGWNLYDCRRVHASGPT